MQVAKMSHASKHSLSPEKPDGSGTSAVEPAAKRINTAGTMPAKSPATLAGKSGPVRQSKLTDFFAPVSSKESKTAVRPGDVVPVPVTVVEKPAATIRSAAESVVVRNNVIDVRAMLRTMQTDRQLEVHHSIGPTWFTSILQDEFEKPYYNALSKQLAAERKQYKIYPPAELIWTWTTFFDCNDTKVVIIGQDPYHGAGQAHGLCFSVMPNVAVPASLRNIYEELEQDVDGFKRPKHGCLRGWARQGVLLLNAVLTVRAGQANSHQKKIGWEMLTDAVVNWLNKHGDGIVFMLWGQYAQAKCAKVDTKRHLVLRAAHPSPLAGGKFKNCKHFSQANTWLVAKGRKPINWTDLTEM